MQTMGLLSLHKVLRDWWILLEVREARIFLLLIGDALEFGVVLEGS